MYKTTSKQYFKQTILSKESSKDFGTDENEKLYEAESHSDLTSAKICNICGK